MDEGYAYNDGREGSCHVRVSAKIKQNEEPSRRSSQHSTPIDANVWSYLKDQLTEQIGFILPREAAGEVDGGGKIRHG